MNTCSEMIINCPRVRVSEHWSIDEDFEISVSLIQPVYDELRKQGYLPTKIGRGSPYGCGFELEEGKCRVFVYFYCCRSEDSKNTEGFIRIQDGTTTLREIFHIHNRKKERGFLKTVLPDISRAIELNPYFTGVSWVSLEHHCSAIGYGQAESQD